MTIQSLAKSVRKPVIIYSWQWVLLNPESTLLLL